MLLRFLFKLTFIIAQKKVSKGWSFPGYGQGAVLKPIFPYENLLKGFNKWLLLAAHIGTACAELPPPPKFNY